MKPRLQQTSGGELPLFPGLPASPETAAPPELLAKAAGLLTMARACPGKLWDIDRAAARLLVEAPGLPLRGRCALELARFRAASRGVEAHFLNALAQIAPRRCRAACWRIVLKADPAIIYPSAPRPKIIFPFVSLFYLHFDLFVQISPCRPKRCRKHLRHFTTKIHPKI